MHPPRGPLEWVLTTMYRRYHGVFSVWERDDGGRRQPQSWRPNLPRQVGSEGRDGDGCGRASQVVSSWPLGLRAFSPAVRRDGGECPMMYG